MTSAHTYFVKKYFSGVPKRDDFEVKSIPLRVLEDGEFLVKTEWISVDPYLRGYNGRVPLPYKQFGYQVGLVEKSKNEDYPVGSRVVSHEGWTDYAIIGKEHGTGFLDMHYKLPDLQGLPISLGIGAVGMPGVTAYFGLLELCTPKPGETVVVTGAAGAVGSLVGQIAKIKGCRVIGFAGSDVKTRWLENDLGFDKAFNYKKVDAAVALKEAAPNGVDCYFDNVGGELSSIIIRQMNSLGRVACCGAISTYNATGQPASITLQPSMINKQLRIEGFIAGRWIGRWEEAFTELVLWIKSGQLKASEHITEGFDKIFDAFVGMLNGDNLGKAVVKV